MKLPVNYDSLTWKQRKQVREQYIKQQNRICSHCGKSLYGPPSEEVRSLKINKSLFPEYFFNHSIHLHHDHDTGMTIGAVHSRCNAVLWQYYGE